MEEVARFFSGSVPAHSAHLQHHSMLLSNHSSVFPQITPQLVITKQKTHSEEIISKNGLQKTIFVVVKNSPFHFTLGVTGANSKLDFNQIAFEAFLLYDCEGDKEVDFIKTKPMEFKPTPTENGQQLEVELRIKVLSSQHEDMLFKVKLQGFNPVTKEEVSGLALITPAIKVISKPEQLKKKQPSKKRTITDMLVDTVTRIEKKQEDQQKLIERMLTQQSSSNVMEKRQKIDETIQSISNLFWEEMNNESNQSNQSNVQKTEEKKEKETTAVPEFEQAFANLIKAFNSMKPEEKPEIIRKLIRNSSTRDTERLSELLDLFWTEGLQREPSFVGKTNARERLAANSSMSMKEDGMGCSCGDCPHKQELERIDEFYKEFLASGVSVPGF